MKVEEKRYQYGPGEWRVRDGCKAVVLAKVGDKLVGYTLKEDGKFEAGSHWGLDGRFAGMDMVPEGDLIAPWEDEGAPLVKKSDIDRDAYADKLADKIDGLKADLDSALDVLWRRGDDEARVWVRLNYPDFTAKKRKAAPRSGTVWLNVWARSDGTYGNYGFNGEEAARSWAERSAKQGMRFVKVAMPIEWTEDE